MTASFSGLSAMTVVFERQRDGLSLLLAAPPSA